MTEAPASRRLDHLVLMVRDLDAAETRFHELGFDMSARNHHPFGTSNNLAVFDGNFLEVLGVTDASKIPAHSDVSYSFAARCRDFLAETGEGVGMIVLDSADGRADHRSFAAAGFQTYEPVDFSRGATQPDGHIETVTFTICFLLHDAIPNLPHFVCQQHNPEYFWHPEFQQHANTARRLDAVTIWSDDPGGLAAFYGRLFGDAAVAPADGGFDVAMSRGRIRVRSRESAAREFGVTIGAGSPQVVAISVAVADLDAARRVLSARVRGLEDNDGCLRVPASEAAGVIIEFVADGGAGA